MFSFVVIIRWKREIGIPPFASFFTVARAQFNSVRASRPISVIISASPLGNADIKKSSNKLERRSCLYTAPIARWRWHSENGRAQNTFDSFSVSYYIKSSFVLANRNWRSTY